MSSKSPQRVGQSCRIFIVLPDALDTLLTRDAESEVHPSPAVQQLIKWQEDTAVVGTFDTLLEA